MNRPFGRHVGNLGWRRKVAVPKSGGSKKNAEILKVSIEYFR